MSKGLKPCPFCGGPANEYRRNGRKGCFVFVACETCGASSRTKSAYYVGDEDEFWKQGAVKIVEQLWNMRST